MGLVAKTDRQTRSRARSLSCTQALSRARSLSLTEAQQSKPWFPSGDVQASILHASCPGPRAGGKGGGEQQGCTCVYAYVCERVRSFCAERGVDRQASKQAGRRAHRRTHRDLRRTRRAARILIVRFPEPCTRQRSPPSIESIFARTEECALSFSGSLIGTLSLSHGGFLALTQGLSRALTYHPAKTARLTMLRMHKTRQTSAATAASMPAHPNNHTKQHRNKPTAEGCPAWAHATYCTHTHTHTHARCVCACACA